MRIATGEIEEQRGKAPNRAKGGLRGGKARETAHKSPKGVSAAMQAGVSDTLWSMADLAEMVDAALPKPGRRGPYKTKAA